MSEISAKRFSGVITAGWWQETRAVHYLVRIDLGTNELLLLIKVSSGDVTIIDVTLITHTARESKKSVVAVWIKSVNDYITVVYSVICLNDIMTVLRSDWLSIVSRVLVESPNVPGPFTVYITLVSISVFQTFSVDQREDKGFNRKVDVKMYNNNVK